MIVRTSFDTEPTSTAGAIVDGAGLDSGVIVAGDALGLSAAEINGEATDYLEFSLFQDVGQTTLTGLSFDAYNRVGNASGAFTVSLSTSLDAFGSTIGSANVPHGSGTTFNPFAIAFDDFVIAAGQTVTFRLTIADNGAGFGDDSAFGFDNIVLEGSAIPEPASLGALVLGSASLASRRRQA